jgi:putative membrane protein
VAAFLPSPSKEPVASIVPIRFAKTAHGPAWNFLRFCVFKQTPIQEFKMVSRLQAASAIAAALLSSGACAQAAELTDPQIAHIAYTAGKLDITAAKQALERSANPNVKAFAADMVRDNEAVNKQAIALFKKLRVTPKDNDTSRTLSRNAAVKTKELSKLNGAAFDKAYVDNEVIYHKIVDDALETHLIPSASNAELKDLLKAARKTIQGHEQHAQQVAAELK